MKQIQTVKVTKKDIQNGRPASASRCPISRAIRRVTSIRPVHVYGGDAQIGDGWYDLPKVCEQFVNIFDKPKSRWKAQPFVFEAKLPV